MQGQRVSQTRNQQEAGNLFFVPEVDGDMFFQNVVMDPLLD
jgi:hypothetical protein